MKYLSRETTGICFTYHYGTSRKSNHELDTWMAGEAQGYRDRQQKIPVTKFIRD
jgi:hypothetical protein